MSRFRSKTHGMNQRRMVWVCKQPRCHSRHNDKKPAVCSSCGHKDFHYFPSRGEADRFFQLLLLQRAGEITDLKTQVNFPCKVNGRVVTTYRADFTYNDKSGKHIIEDAKPKGFTTDVFEIKKKLVEALFGIEVTLYQS